MKKNIPFSIMWLINVISLAVIILIPKTETSYSILSLLTMLMIFIIPLVLIFSQAYMRVKESISTTGDTDEVENNHTLKRYNFDLVIPNGGCILIILLTFLNFIGSIEKIAIPEVVTILVVFVSIELFLSYLLMVYDSITKKQFIYINVGTYVSLMMFFFCMMIMSVDYGII